jgi:hypothetical protein
MTIPFPSWGKGAEPSPSNPPQPPPPPKPVGPELVENAWNQALMLIKANAERAAIDAVDMAGDQDRIGTLVLAAAAEIHSLYRRPVDSAHNEHDRAIHEQLASLRDQLKHHENKTGQLKALADKAALDAPQEVPRPKPNMTMMAAAVALFAFEVGLSIEPLVSSRIDDGPTALGVAMLAGVVTGIVIVYGAMGGDE